MIVIEQVRPADAQKAIDYLKLVLSETDNVPKTPDEVVITLEEEEKILKSVIASDNSIMLAAKEAGQIVGFLSLMGSKRLRSKHTGTMGISVRKSHWGQGIGRLMIQDMLSWAKETGILKKINLTVREDNDRAISLYKSMGFKEEGFETMKHHTKGRYYGVYHMGIQL